MTTRGRDDEPHYDPTPTPPSYAVRNESPYSDPTPTAPAEPPWDEALGPAGAARSGEPGRERPALPGSGRERGLALPTHPDVLTRVLLLVNIGMFILLSLLSRGGFMEAVLGGADGRTLVALGAKENSLIRLGEYWRLLTPIFLHIGIVHLFFNSYALNLFGRELEGLFGSFRFAVIYFLSGIAGSILSFAFSPYTAAGASGAIFGVIGAMAAFLIRNRETLGARGMQHLRSLIGLIGINLVFGFTLPGIDNYGHIGGLIAGFAAGFLLSPTYRLEPTNIPPHFQRVVEKARAIPTAAVALAGGALLAALFWLALPVAPV